MEAPPPPAEPEEPRLRDIPARAIFPSVLTLLAIASGITAIRFAAEGRIGPAVAAIILAALLDALDGRVARLLKSTSRFGAELDSLADFVNFGVAPALIVYFALLDGLRSFGFIAALIYAICVCLRLARFNVMLDRPGPKWRGAFFTGVPAPAGAGLVMLPVYLRLLGLPDSIPLDLAASVYTVGVGVLMVSTLPTWSAKDLMGSIPRAQVLTVLIAAVGFFAFLVSYTWHTLVACVIAYFVAMPFAYRDYRRRVAAESAPAAAPPEAE